MTTVIDEGIGVTAWFT